MTASADGTALTLQWTYTTDAGSRSGRHKLALPAGSVALDSLTEATLLNWLSEQLPEDVEEQLDAQIAKDNERATIREFSMVGGSLVEVVEEVAEEEA